MVRNDDNDDKQSQPYRALPNKDDDVGDGGDDAGDDWNDKQ